VKNWDTWLAAIFIFAVVGGIAYIAIQSPSPDQSVFRAAESMVKLPTVSNGHFAVIGCSNGDVYRYDVTTPDGKYVGYVCKGFLKGATARF
jgi:hypothetical protein